MSTTNDAKVHEQEEEKEEEDILQFHLRSSDRPPGEGTGERVSESRKRRYETLQTIKDWRRIFSDTWDGEELVWRGVRYRTHQHAFQAAKFQAAGLPNMAYRFSIDSDDPIGTGSAVGAYRRRKMVKLTAKQLEQWEMQRQKCKNEIYACKYREGSRAAEALLATEQAVLVNHPPRMRRVVCTRLMERRTELQKRRRVSEQLATDGRKPRPKCPVSTRSMNC